MNTPRRHHFVPQFFLKSWLINERLYCYGIKDKKLFTNSTKNIGLKKNLYVFNGKEIETELITPYIDNYLYKTIIEVRKTKNKWNELDNSIKSQFFKFLILLDARNPESLNFIASAYESIRDEIDLSEIDSELDNSIQDPYFGFICIVLHELGLEIEENNTAITSDFDRTFYRTQKMLNLLNDKMDSFPKPYLSHLLNKKTKVIEVDTQKKDSFITSTVPVRRIGKYDDKFTVSLSISPTKSFIITNDEEIIQLFNKIDLSTQIKFINSFHFSSKFSYNPETIVLAKKMKLSEVENMIKFANSYDK